MEKPLLIINFQINNEYFEELKFFSLKNIDNKIHNFFHNFQIKDSKIKNLIKNRIFSFFSNFQKIEKTKGGPKEIPQGGPYEKSQNTKEKNKFSLKPNKFFSLKTKKNEEKKKKKFLK